MLYNINMLISGKWELKHSRKKIVETQKGNGIFGFHPYFDIRHRLDGRIVGNTRRPHFTAKEIPCYSFLLETEWTPGLGFYCGQKNWVAWKFLKTSPSMEPKTSRLLAHCLNQKHHRSSPLYDIYIDFSGKVRFFKLTVHAAGIIH